MEPTSLLINDDRLRRNGEGFPFQPRFNVEKRIREPAGSAGYNRLVVGLSVMRLDAGGFLAHINCLGSGSSPFKTDLTTDGARGVGIDLEVHRRRFRLWGGNRFVFDLP